MLGRLLRRRAPGEETPDPELLRAARILAIRSRREASGLFTGRYAAAFRGTGMEFDESRPYVPGDDPRRMDWNAMARTGEPFVKRFREERGRTVLLALDVSASMAFGSGARSKAEVGAHLVALLAAAAGQAGDRVGLVAFDETTRLVLPPARGSVHAWRIVEIAAGAARRPAGRTEASAASDALRALAAVRSVIFVVSDFRMHGGEGRIAQLAARHDVVCGVLSDPREESLPAVARVRIDDAEAPGRPLTLATSSLALRQRYAAAARARRRELERALRAAGADVLHARTDRDPLRTLTHFFDERAARGRRATR